MFVLAVADRLLVTNLTRCYFETIEKIAKDQNFDLIVYQGVAYASPKIDITDQIIKALGK